MNIKFRTNPYDCIYPRDVTRVIKDHWGYIEGHYGMISEEEFNKLVDLTYYGIWGDRVPQEFLDKLAPNTRLNDCTAYCFYVEANGYHPVRVTASAKMIAERERARKRFAHLEPDCDIE